MELFDKFLSWLNVQIDVERASVLNAGNGRSAHSHKTRLATLEQTRNVYKDYKAAKEGKA